MIRIHKQSAFKNPQQDHAWFEDWVNRLQTLNGKTYTRIIVKTALGNTCVWGVNTQNTALPPLVIFPGARTTVLFWDLDNGLAELQKTHRLYLIETNGLPNLSDGATPDIKGTGYGEWAAEVLEKLGIPQTAVVGASFGGLICMKLAITNPEKVKAAFLLNPGCLQPFSMSFKNLYYNILPIVSPKRKNVALFLDKAVFCKPQHALSLEAENLLVEYEVFALTRYADKTQKPYYMNQELKNVPVPVYLFEGDHDLLFPYQKSIDNARKHLPRLQETKVFAHVGHGIETHAEALHTLADRLKTLPA